MTPTVTMKRLLTALLLLCLVPAALPAQTPDDAPIRELIAQLDRGETEAVRRQLPEYVAKYQNHPGLLFVQARVATDGIEAAKLYQSVIDNYPASEWADDALYNLYQYYYAMGLYMTADLKLQQIRKEYPQSEYLSGRPPASTVAPAAAPAGGQPDAKAAPPASPGAVSADTSPAPVKVTPSGQTIEPGPPAAGSNPYTLQVGAFSTSDNARKQKAMFEEYGYAAEITNRVRSGKSLYLVWVGSFPNADEARKVLREIQARYNITPIVVER
jgi:cell division septation protein DedD